MSQWQLGLTAGSLPPSVPTSFVTDSGTATPAANVLNILTNDTTANNNNGIQDTGSGNTVTILLTNRVQGSVTTTDATATTVITFTPTAVGVYSFDVNIASFNTTDTLGASYSVFVGARSDGVTTTKLNLEDKISNEEAGDTACNASVTTSGNTLLFQVTGIAGKTINWNAVGTYVYVGA